MLYGYREFHCIHKNKRYLLKVLQKMLKLDLILQIMNWTEHCLKQKIKKATGLNKDELGGKILTKCDELRANTYSYLIDDNNEGKKKKTKGRKNE